MLTPQTTELARTTGDGLESGRREYEDGPSFFSRFAGALEPVQLQDKVVLDLGCGYGGRTAYYADTCRARRVDGNEVSDAVVDRCQRLAPVRRW